MRLFSVLVVSWLMVLATADLGVSGKFKNLTNRKMRLFWVDHQGNPYLNGIIRSERGTSFATYPGHEFFWAEMSGREVPTTAPGIPQDMVRFKIRADDLMYGIMDDTSDKQEVDRYMEEKQFNELYYKKYGRQWLANYPQDPPIFKLRGALHVGHEERFTIDADAARWLCSNATDPACREHGEREFKLKVVSIKPRAFVVENFMTDFECDEIIKFYEPHMERSTTGDGENAKVDKMRTSMSGRMNRVDGYIQEAIYRRMAAAVDMPQELIDNSQNSEPVNVVHYLVGQEYTPHYDAGADGNANSRFISGLLYFNTPEEGGTTSFPKSPSPHQDGKIGVSLPAKKGNFMFFYDKLEDGNFDDFSLHSGDPVIKGEKWIGAAWLWEPHYNQRYFDIEKYKTSTVPSLFDDRGKPKLEILTEKYDIDQNVKSEL